MVYHDISGNWLFHICNVLNAQSKWKNLKIVGGLMWLRLTIYRYVRIYLMKFFMIGHVAYFTMFERLETVLETPLY